MTGEAAPIARSDEPLPLTPGQKTVAGSDATLKQDSAPALVVGDVPVLALYGLIFASAASGRAQRHSHVEDVGSEAS